MAAPNNGINLLPETRFEKSGWGKFLKWALTVGRYIVIFTELIVILAFLSRFKLDRDLTDLYERIEQKQAIIESAKEFEDDFRLLQKKISVIKELEADQLDTSLLMQKLTPLVPANVVLTNLNFKSHRLEVSAETASEVSLRTFLNNLLNSSSFGELSLGRTKKDTTKNLITFIFSAKYFPHAD